ncbi:MAG: hypothetical protein HYX60_08125 [Legionella longbeachae]|nr:hypothetical protein [Legionella longbeachae]
MKEKTELEIDNHWEMNKIEPFHPGRLPKKEIKLFIKNVNSLIDKYNNEQDNLQRKTIINQIQSHIKTMEYQFGERMFEESPGYRKASSLLFLEIKYQLENLQISPLDQNKKPSILAEMIANLHPKKASKFLYIFQQNNPSRYLPRLYDKENHSEAIYYTLFWKLHSIEFLGGQNSKNYKITDNKGNIRVLKIENRLNLPRTIEMYLREQDALKERFTSIEVDRQVTYVDFNKKKPITRTIIVTQFCEHGNLIEQRERINDKNIESIQNHAIDIFTQMAQILLHIQNAGCMFPDGKIFNWLLDKNGNLRIADTKSFLFTKKNGHYPKSEIIPGNDYCKLVSTIGFNPPEFFMDEEVTSDGVHAFILGKNIYAYTCLAIYSEDFKNDKFNCGQDLNFTHDVFKTPKGIALKHLIIGLVTSSTTQRMTVKEALETLNNLNQINYAKTDRFKIFQSKLQISISPNEIVEDIKGLSN